MSVFERIRRVIAHLTIALSVTFVFLVVLDYYNPLMSFLTNRISIILLLAFCACSAFTAAARLVITSPAAQGIVDIPYGSREYEQRGGHPSPRHRSSQQERW
jgi:hypothetical protein